MSSVVISGDSSGTVTLTVPSAAGTNTATLPAATGTVMVSGNMPAFSAYKTSTQSITSNVGTKITFDTKEFDTNNCFSSSRFTPAVAGYYQINAVTYITVGSGTTVNAKTLLQKNGTTLRQGSWSNSAVTEAQSLVSTIVYLNGTTDYVETWAVIVGTSPAIYGDANGFQYTYFNGSLVRGA